VSWLAILLSLAALGGNPAPGQRPTVKQCKQIQKVKIKKQCLKAAKAKPKKQGKAKPKAPGKPTTGRQDAPPSTSPTHRSPDTSPDADPQATPTPTPSPGANPTPTPSPTPGPVYPSRTGVDLTDTEVWSIRVTYRTLAAGRIEFVTTNVGEDDHDLSVRRGTDLLGQLPLPPGESDTLTLTLAAGSYTLFCSLPDHEAAGMRANVTVR
jgi:Copper binding proteins, plastocyanin/azurin family